MAAEERLKVILDAVDRTAAPLRAMNRRLEGMLAPVRKVQNAFKNLATEAGLPKLGAALSSVGRQLAKVTVVGVGAAGGFLEFVRRTAEAADSLGDMTSGLGISAERFQELQYATQIAGVSSEDYARSMRVLAKNLGDMRAGTGELSTLLEKHLPWLKKDLLATDDLGDATERLFAELRRLQDPFKRNTLAAKAWGESGQSMARIAETSAESFADLVREFRGFGGGFSAAQISAAGRVTDALDRLKAVVQGVANSVAAELFPQLEQGADGMRLWLQANREWLQTEIIGTIRKTTEVAQDWLKWLRETTPKVVGFVEAIGGLRTVFLALGASLAAKVINPLIQLGSAVVAIVGGVTASVFAMGAAVAYLLVQIEKLTGIKRRILDVIDPFTSTSLLGGAISSVGQAFSPSAPRVVNLKGPDAGIVDEAKAANRDRLDVSGLIRFAFDQRGGLRLTGSESTVPGIGFGMLPRGPVLAPN